MSKGAKRYKPYFSVVCLTTSDDCRNTTVVFKAIEERF